MKLVLMYRSKLAYIYNYFGEFTRCVELYAFFTVLYFALNVYLTFVLYSWSSLLERIQNHFCIIQFFHIDHYLILSARRNDLVSVNLLIIMNKLYCVIKPEFHFLLDLKIMKFLLSNSFNTNNTLHIWRELWENLCGNFHHLFRNPNLNF